MEARDPASDNNDRGVLSALRDFFDAARRTPRDVIVVFLGMAVLGIVSYQLGSKRFFIDHWYQELSADPLFELYQFVYWFSSEFVIYFLAPLLLITLLHGRAYRRFGLGAGDWRFGLKVSGIFFAVMLPILWLVSATPAFQQVYPHASIVRGDWNLFLIYEAAFLLYFIGWEFIWRGYVLFGLAPHTGASVAVLVQMIPFVIFHFGKPWPETAGSIIAAIALGALSLRTRSFWYAVLIHWSVMFTIDGISTLRFRAAADGIGFDALRAVFSALLG